MRKPLVPMGVTADALLARLIWFGIILAAALAGTAFVVWFGGNELLHLIRVFQEIKGQIIEAFQK